MADAQDTEAYAVVCFRLDGRWEVDVLPEVLTGDLRGLVSAVAQQPGELGAFALVDVADEFFVVVRVQEGRPHVLLSDVTAAAEWDLAAQVLDHLGLTVPVDDGLEEIWPAGDLSIFDDMGLDAMEMGAILSDDDAYADEMLSALAERLGFADSFERVVDAIVGTG